MNEFLAARPESSSCGAIGITFVGLAHWLFIQPKGIHKESTRQGICTFTSLLLTKSSLIELNDLGLILFSLCVCAHFQYGKAFTIDLLFVKMTFLVGPEGNKLFFDAKNELLDFDRFTHLHNTHISATHTQHTQHTHTHTSTALPMAEWSSSRIH